jgi:DNA-binding transcriptional LysR family regulator
MDRIDAMRVFARVVERGSFVRGAEDPRLPASTATDAVKQLEARLGVRLLERTTRQVRATLDGEAYYRRCLSILDDIEEAENALHGARPRGLLRVDVQGTQARRFIVPAGGESGPNRAALAQIVQTVHNSSVAMPRWYRCPDVRASSVPMQLGLNWPRR